MDINEIHDYAREQNSYIQPGRFFEDIYFKLTDFTMFRCFNSVLKEKDNYFIVYTELYSYLILPKCKIEVLYKNNKLIYSNK